MYVYAQINSKISRN